MGLGGRLSALCSLSLWEDRAPFSVSAPCSERSFLGPDFDTRGAGASFETDAEVGFNASVLMDLSSVLSSWCLSEALPASAQHGNDAGLSPNRILELVSVF